MPRNLSMPYSSKISAILKTDTLVHVHVHENSYSSKIHKYCNAAPHKQTSDTSTNYPNLQKLY